MKISKIINKEKIWTHPGWVWFCALICCALWGSAFPMIKIGYSQLDISTSNSSTQILYAGMRFTLAGVLTILIGSKLKGHFLYPAKKAQKKVALLSLFQTVLQYLFFYIGLAHTTGVKASIITGTNVFVALLVAAFIFHQETLSLSKISGCLIGFIGVIVVNMSGGMKGISALFDNFSFVGEGFIFLAAVAYAFSSVIMKRFSKSEEPMMLSGYQFLYGGILMTIIGILAGGKFTTFSLPAVYTLVYLAFVSAAAYSLWGTLLKYNPISKVAVFGFMNPVFGVLLSASLLKEKGQLGVQAIIALLLVCIGICIVNLPEKKVGN